MSKDTTVLKFGRESFSDPLTELLRKGARIELLMNTVQVNWRA
jgi:predicted CopG family antitoxin